ncbi:MAG TPA: aldo/keto reductase [Acidimicrobiales bacterium]|nr:aldo/keto reductase [Acidimicrobiales bacterium]
MRHVECQGVQLSAIGLGCWQFGSKEWGYGAGYADHEAGRIVERALELGINLFDTAEVYGRGQSERILGRALQGHRAEAFVATKVLPILPLRARVVRAAEGSLRRLGIDKIDLYQIHWPNPVVPLGQQLGGMRELQQRGLVDHVGVSNYSLARWRAAEAALGAPVLTNQVPYSLADRRPEAELVPWAAANDRIVMAYSPLAQGLLSARYDETNAPGGVRRNNALFLPDNLRSARPLLDALRAIATAHGATPSQVALAWLVRRPNVVAIPGASSVAQLEQNAAAADLDLSEDEDAELTAASDAFRPVRGAAAVPKLVERRLRR